MKPPATAESRGPRHVVWIVNQYAGSPAHGMAYRHYDLGREFVRLGMTVVVVSGSYSHLLSHQPSMTGRYTVEEIDGLTYCWVNIPTYRHAMSLGRVINMLAFTLRLYRLPVRRLPTPSAIIVSSPSPFPILPAERWARRWGCRLVFEVRDLWPLTLQELGGLSARHPLVTAMSWVERRAYRVADWVVSLLPAAGAHFEAHGMAPRKLRVIPNGAGEDALAEPTTRPPEAIRAAAAGGDFIVGFVGTLGMANALEGLIGAARLLVNEGVRFLIVGQGPDDERLRALALGLDNVEFTGAVARSDLPASVRAFDVGYVGYHRSPLYRFGVSANKAFDYMAAGRPIILAAEAANDPVLEAHCGITVPPDDPMALAEGIRSLRAMPAATLAQLGANGRAYVEREHTYRILAERYLSVIGGNGA